MYSLKAELFKKQKEFASSHGATKPETIRKQHRLKSGVSSGDAKASSEQFSGKKNPGVAARNEKDRNETQEEEDKESKVEAVLRAKSKLYDTMTSGGMIPSEESSSMFLVDFEQKSIEAWRTRREKEIEKESIMKLEVEVDVTSDIERTLNSAENEWVEYVDALGRTRMVKGKDLPSLQRMDKKLEDAKSVNQGGVSRKTLISGDMRREAEREKWEEQAAEEINGPMHYESLRAGEIRELGVGYYTFSTDQEMRDAQMRMLLKMREDTKREKEILKQANEKKRSALQARLERVRERRIKKLKSQEKDIPPKLLQPVQLFEEEESDGKEDPQEESVENNQQPENAEADNTKTRKLREWDKGKEWLPAALPQAPKSWKDPREERPEEFAPPSFYYKGNKKKTPQNNVSQLSCTEGLTVDSKTIPCTLPQQENLISCTSETNHPEPDSSSTFDTEQENPSVHNDIKTRTSRVLDFLRHSSSQKEVKRVNNEEFASSLYNPTASDKPVTIKIKPLKSKTKNLLAKSALDEIS